MDKLIDIWPAKLNYREGYVGYVPQFKERRFIRYLGLEPKGEKARIFKQQPPGIWIDGFGYGPMTGRIGKPLEIVEMLRGNYERFPELPRTKKRYERRIVEPPSIDLKDFKIIAAETPAGEEKIFELMRTPEFFAAVTSIFREAEIPIGALGAFSLETVAQPAEMLA